MIDTSLAHDAGPVRSTFADDADFAELLEVLRRRSPKG